MRVLACAPHPDDAELHCGGTLAMPCQTRPHDGVIDCTRGEMGVAQSLPMVRAEEVSNAAPWALPPTNDSILRCPMASLLEHQADLMLRLVNILREFQPDLILATNLKTRHPDHHAVAQQIAPALKAAALHKWPIPPTSRTTHVLSKRVRSVALRNRRPPWSGHDPSL